MCESYCDNLKEKKLGLFICCMNEENVEKQIKDNFPEKLILSANSRVLWRGF